MASNGGRCGPRWHATEAYVRNTYTHCHLCHKPVNFQLARTHSLGWTVDHIHPVIHGGALYDHGNAQLAHSFCNTQRGAKPLDEYRRWQTMQGTSTAGPSRQWLKD